MSFPGFSLLGFDNLYERSGVALTDPSEKTGYPASRLRDRIHWLSWRPDGLSASEDYIVDLGVGNTAAGRMFAYTGRHNGGSKGLTFAWAWSNNGSSWTTILSFSPADDRDVVVGWTQATGARYFRKQVSGITDDSPEIAEAWIGQAVMIPDSVTWRNLDDKTPTSQLSISRAQKTGNAVRANVRGLSWARRVGLSWVNRPTAFLDDPEVGFGYWWDEIASDGDLFVWHPHASLEDEFRYAGGLSQVRGDVRRPQVSDKDDGARSINFQLVNAGVP